MIRVPNVAVSLDHEAQSRGCLRHSSGPLVRAVAKQLKVKPSQVKSAETVRRSIDARKKSNVHFNVTAKVELNSENAEAAAIESGRAQAAKPHSQLQIPTVDAASPGYVRPVVVGLGPAGLFCALALARAGARPIVLERGASVRKRSQIVATFNAGGPFNARTNVQFGEGGAGTFSDGKLTTNIKHPLAPYVIDWFVQAGAPDDILWDAKPHIGSDKLPHVVERMRREIVERGGEVLFETQLVGASFADGALETIEVADSAGARTRISAQRLVLACGHSARDTFAAVQRWGLPLEQKPFAMGVRIEHAQAAVNRAQWGKFADHPALRGRAADYKLVAHVSKQRSAYTFCMCPGGEVVCAASEEGGVVTNGMSNYARDGENANAALLVNVDPADFGAADPLAGVRLQRAIEQRAYQVALEAGGSPYQAPSQTVGSFLRSVDDAVEPAVAPTYARGVVSADLRKVLPPFICDTIASALPLLDRKLHGFADPGAVMTAPETRSSSPVRICREADLQAHLAGRAHGSGVYPCGEGAGYAGGIMSAAADGLRVGIQLARDLQAQGE